MSSYNTVCGACFYINRKTNTQCPRKSYCKDFNCLLRWINCSYRKSVQSQVRWPPYIARLARITVLFISQFVSMIAAATDKVGTSSGLKYSYGTGGFASDLFTIL